MGWGFSPPHLHQQRDLLKDLLLRGTRGEDTVEAEVVTDVTPAFAPHVRLWEKGV